MAIVDGNLVLCLPACKMALKDQGCPECQYRSCMALAERTVRLAIHRKVNRERHAEMKKQMEQHWNSYVHSQMLTTTIY